jgi:ABC-type uncharacterized transport system permease subunit
VGALRHYRGVNETIASLLMAYIAIALMNHLVEGPLRDPASLNKPSTAPLAEHLRIGNIPGWDVHWGLVVGIVACILSWMLIERTTWGFAARIAGGNVRAAQVQGLPVGRLILGFTALGGAFAGLAGRVRGRRGAWLGQRLAGFGLWLYRHPDRLSGAPQSAGHHSRGDPAGRVRGVVGPCPARMDLPDATVLVLQGFVFVAILVSETLYGRLRLFAPERWRTG